MGVEGNGKIFCFDDPKSPTAEVFRTLRTNILHLSVENNIKSILVTSAQPREGKTSLVVELGAAIAQEGLKVLLVDCDLRRPTLHQRFFLPGNTGLSSVLLKNCLPAEVTYKVSQEGLHVMPAGLIPPNPSELLSYGMRDFIASIKEQYDIILLDSPPVIPVTDAQVISKLADAVLLVIHAGKTLQSDVKKACQLLKHVGGNLIGSVLNQKRVEISSYYL